jgi:hypothetical protein
MTTLDLAHKDRAHSYVGGSTAKRVMNCTASVNLCEKYPNVETTFAAEGTALHEAIDLIFQGKLKNEREVIGLVFNGHTITEDLYEDAIAPALAMWDALEAEIGPIDYYNEKRVTFPGIENAFGTVDLVGRGKDRSIVWDWKFGRGVSVTADWNEQLMYYAYAAAHSFPTDQFFDRDRPIELFICQPMVREGKRFTRWTTSMAQLEVFALELRKAVEISQTSEATFRMGSWCRFCNAKTGCPEYGNTVSNVSKMTRTEAEEELARWLPYADTMIEWGEHVKQAAHRLLEQGGAVPGYKLVAKRANRSWHDEDTAKQFLIDSGVPDEDMYVKKFVSPAQAEKALKAVGVREMPNSLVDKISTGTTLVPEDDERSAMLIAPDAFKMLADRLAAKS